MAVGVCGGMALWGKRAWSLCWGQMWDRGDRSQLLAGRCLMAEVSNGACPSLSAWRPLRMCDPNQGKGLWDQAGLQIPHSHQGLERRSVLWSQTPGGFTCIPKGCGMFFVRKTRVCRLGGRVHQLPALSVWGEPVSAHLQVPLLPRPTTTIPGSVPSCPSRIPWSWHRSLPWWHCSLPCCPSGTHWSWHRSLPWRRGSLPPTPCSACPAPPRAPPVGASSSRTPGAP